jgi:hypothetical protein
MHCDGKCYLAKRLKAQQDGQDKKNAPRVRQMALIQLFCEAHLCFAFVKPFTFISTPIFTYLTGLYATPSHRLLKPPCRFTSKWGNLLFFGSLTESAGLNDIP